MSDSARFWRNVTLIAGAHVVLVIAFVRWSGAAKTNASQQIVWLSGSEAANAAARLPAGEPAQGATPTETPEPQEQATIAPAKSEIQLPVVTPTPTATPRRVVKLSPPPVAKPAQAAKPALRAAPKNAVAKSTPKPKAKPVPLRVGDEEDASEAGRDGLTKLTGARSGGGGPGGSSSHAETQWYGRMLHDRFHNAWDQPTTVVASGAKMSVLVKARIEKDGRVSRFELTRPSGNVVVDESVRAIASKVTQVDPLPNGVGTGEHYDVTINFELNAEE